ncbi:MAG: radical SAM protein [Alphaproteobacteria bacterium]|nr:radical SAM protein [Alphaproteobacteria bacterium]
MATLNIHYLLEKSSVNGPGKRFVLWTQGCPLRCKGCFNPKTHSMDGGTFYEISNLADTINKTNGIRGITISGGEPLIQVEEIIALLKQIRSDLDVLLFSGYTLAEIEQDPTKNQILKYIDAGLFGRYMETQPHPFMNKKLVIRGERIKTEELHPYLKTELIINDNIVTTTGLFKKGT